MVNSPYRIKHDVAMHMLEQGGFLLMCHFVLSGITSRYPISCPVIFRRSIFNH